MSEESKKTIIIAVIVFMILFILVCIFNSGTSAQSHAEFIPFDVPTGELETGKNTGSWAVDDATTQSADDYNPELDVSKKDNEIKLGGFNITYDKDKVRTDVITDENNLNAAIVHFSDVDNSAYISASITAAEIFTKEEEYPQSVSQARAISEDFDIPYDETERTWSETNDYYIRLVRSYSWNMASSVVAYQLIPKKSAKDGAVYGILFYSAENCPLSKDVYNNVMNNLRHKIPSVAEVIPDYDSISSDLEKILKIKSADEKASIYPVDNMNW